MISPASLPILTPWTLNLINSEVCLLNSSVFQYSRRPIWELKSQAYVMSRRSTLSWSRRERERSRSWSKQEIMVTMYCNKWIKLWNQQTTARSTRGTTRRSSKRLPGKPSQQQAMIQRPSCNWEQDSEEKELPRHLQLSRGQNEMFWKWVRGLSTINRRLIVRFNN